MREPWYGAITNAGEVSGAGRGASRGQRMGRRTGEIQFAITTHYMDLSHSGYQHGIRGRLTLTVGALPRLSGGHLVITAREGKSMLPVTSETFRSLQTGGKPLSQSQPAS